VITELPIGKWTMQYTKFLEELVDGTVDKDGKKIPPIIKDFTSLCTEVNVHFTVVFPRGKLAEIDVEKVLKLTTTVKTSNIHMFDDKCKLKKFENVDEIIREYYQVRLEAYKKRKAYLVDAMTKKMELLTNKAKYIEYTLIDKIDLRRKSADAVEEMLSKHAFVKIDGDYKYLVKMPMDSVTSENVEKLRRERDETLRELEVLKQTTLEQMWLSELDVLEAKYRDYKKLLLPGPGSHLMSVASTIRMYNHTLKKTFQVKRKQLGLTQEAKGALL
jgi:DNA topoisomerase-2